MRRETCGGGDGRAGRTRTFSTSGALDFERRRRWDGCRRRSLLSFPLQGLALHARARIERQRCAEISIGPEVTPIEAFERYHVERQSHATGHGTKGTLQ